MSEAERFRKLAALGLSTEQIAGVLELMDGDREKRRANGRERWRKWNDKRLANVSQQQPTLAVNSRAGDARGEDNLLPTEIAGKKKTKTLSVHSHPERDFFEEFWHAYPRREGPNPKKPAREKFLRLVAKGVDPERLIEAARKLAEEHPTPTRFVPQALTWLGQERWDNNDYSPRGDEFCPDDWENTRFLIIRYREERKTDPPRSIQGGKAGYLFPAEWVALSRSSSRAANA